MRTDHSMKQPNRMSQYRIHANFTKKQIEKLREFTDSVLYQNKEQGELTEAFKILDKELDNTIKYYNW